MRKFFFGLVWFLVIAFGMLMAGGFVAGFQAALSDPASTADAGAAAGQAFAQHYGGRIFVAALIISIVGSAFGWLPGTRRNRT